MSLLGGNVGIWGVGVGLGRKFVNWFNKIWGELYDVQSYMKKLN